MKKLIIIFIASSITTIACVKNDSTNRIMGHTVINQTEYSQSREMEYNSNPDFVESMDLTTKHPTQMKSLADGVMKVDGKMMLVMDDRLTLFDHNMTMTNGTTIMPDGSYINIDGPIMMFNEGHHIDMSGKIAPIEQAIKSNNPMVNADIGQNINDSQNPYCPLNL